MGYLCLFICAQLENITTFLATHAVPLTEAPRTPKGYVVPRLRTPGMESDRAREQVRAVGRLAPERKEGEDSPP